MAVYAVDAGGTKIKLAVIDHGKVLARASLDANSEQGFFLRLPEIAATLRRISPSGLDLSGIGIAFPSLIDSESRRVIGHVGKYKDASEIDLAAWARKEFTLELVIENDARMAAIGEWRYGVGQGFANLVMVTLGTGIGTGVIMHGEPLIGVHGQAGILGGHFVMTPDGRPCACGARGCYETEASTAWLPRLAAEDPAFDICLLKNLDYEGLFAAADQGDPSAIRLRDRSLSVWAALSVTLVHAYDPEILIFGGGILESGEATLGSIRKIVYRDAWTPWGKPPVVKSQLGSDAALLACEWLIDHQLILSHERAST